MHIFTTGVLCCTPRGKGITGITSKFKYILFLKNIYPVPVPG